MTPEEQTAVLQRWQQAGSDQSPPTTMRSRPPSRPVGPAERAVLDVVGDSQEPPSPTRVLELLARRRNGVTQSAGALAIQRLVASGRLHLTSDASLELIQAA